MKTYISSLSSIISKKTINGGQSKDLPKEIAAYLLDHGRTGELSSLLRSVQEDWANDGRVEATVVSAFKVSKTTETYIKTELKKVYPNAKSITLLYEIDPKLVGGLKISTANYQMDLSMLSKLSKFKQLTLS